MHRLQASPNTKCISMALYGRSERLKHGEQNKRFVKWRRKRLGGQEVIIADMLDPQES